jgi:hypothetical protein
LQPNREVLLTVLTALLSAASLLHDAFETPLLPLLQLIHGVTPTLRHGPCLFLDPRLSLLDGNLNARLQLSLSIFNLLHMPGD